MKNRSAMTTMTRRNKTTAQLRRDVAKLLTEMERASDRALHDEILLGADGDDANGDDDVWVGDEEAGEYGEHQQHQPGWLRSMIDDIENGGEEDVDSRSHPSHQGRKKRPRTTSSHAPPPPGKLQGRSWDELLENASDLLPCMTTEEHSRATRLATIFFLGHLLPYSTGNDYFTIAPSSATVDMTSGADKGITPLSSQGQARQSPGFLSMSLEERLENSARSISANHYGEMGACSDLRVTSSFRRLVQHGLGPFLSGRPLPPSIEGADLLHVLAMAITPTVPDGVAEDEYIAGWCHRNDGNAQSSSKQYVSTWTSRARRFMASPIPFSFHLNYADRALLVEVLADQLVVPELKPEPDQSSLPKDETEKDEVYSDENDAPAASGDSEAPLFYGAMPHLRASLFAFATSAALSGSHAKVSYRVLTNAAIQVGYEPYVSIEWNALLESCRIGGRSGEYCEGLHGLERKAANDERPKTVTSVTAGWCCMPTAMGDLMVELITQYSGSRYYSDGTFTQKALCSLSDAVSDHVKYMAKKADSAGVATLSSGPSYYPCQLVSLLKAARVLFYFLLNEGSVRSEQEAGISREQDERQGGIHDDADENHAQEEKKTRALVSDSIQLLRHPDLAVVRQASLMLALAFAYGEEDNIGLYVPILLKSIRHAILRRGHDSIQKGKAVSGSREYFANVANALRPVIVAAARLSVPFAHGLVSLLVVDGKESKGVHSIFSYAAMISHLQPRVISSRYNELESVTSRTEAEQDETLRIVTYLSCRLAHNFSEEEGALRCQETVLGLLKQITDPWRLFQLGRHSIATGNFGVARHIFSSRLLECSSSEESHMWITALSKAADAEDILLSKGSAGIPAAIEALHSSVSYIQSLSLSHGNHSPSHQPKFTFQLHLLRHRIEFLELCSAVRTTSAEMQLVGDAPHRETRTLLHQRNACHCFYALASHYRKLYRMYGIVHCQQTRTVLRTLYALCRFMGGAVGKIFSESLGSGSPLYKCNQEENDLRPKGDSSHPVSNLIRQFESNVLEPMSEHIDPFIRASAMMEMIEVILRTPAPYPRGFLTAKTLPLCSISLLADPSTSSIEKSEFDVPQVDDGADNECEYEGTAETTSVLPGFPCTFNVCGVVPEDYTSRTNIPFTQVVAWHKITYAAPLAADDEPFGEDQQSNVNPLSEDMEKDDEIDDGAGYVPDYESGDTPFASSTLPGGKFLIPIECHPFHREGCYRVDVKIGCRDVRFGEWDLPLATDAGVLFLCVNSQASDYDA